MMEREDFVKNLGALASAVGFSGDPELTSTAVTIRAAITALEGGYADRLASVATKVVKPS